VVAVAALAVCFLVGPIVALAVRAPWGTSWKELSSPEVLEALRLSLFCSTIATVVVVVLGVPLAWVLARVPFPGSRMVRAATTLSMVLPPVVGGVALLAAFGRRGIAGRFLDSWFGVQLPFTTAGVIVAEAFVALPFLVVTLDGAFRTMDRRFEEAAETLGARRWTVFRRVTLPAVAPSFVAGVVLANSEFRHQIEADVKPFKGLLMGLFFMTVGASIDVGVLTAQVWLVLALTFGLIALKAGVLFGLALAFGMRGRDRWLFTFSLAQAGEFGFLLVSMATAQSLLPGPVASLTLLVISLSMLATPALFALHDVLTRLLATPEKTHAPDEISEKGRVIIAGIGRFGQVVNRLVRTAGASTVVLDSDMAAIDTMRRFGVKGFFGDPTRPELLQAAGLAEADVLVVAIDDRDACLKIVRFARQARPDLHIVARARDRIHVYELYQAGANDIVREMFDSSVRAGRYVLENIGFSEHEASRLSQAYYRIDRSAMRDLAEVWVPGQPVTQNPAYVARSRQLDRDLETALIAELDDNQTKAAE